ncbi:MAG: HisA/HisF-related TIM barrel protein, partial [Candidatus Nanohalobium sp.]
EEEMEEAVDAEAEIIGVNNRDLTKLEVNLDTFEEVAEEAPENIRLVAESGIKTVEDAERMLDAGADAMLIGTAIMDGDVEENVEKFAGAGES